MDQRSKKSTPEPILPLKEQMEQMLRNAIIMTEMGMDMKERVAQGEKYICYLRTITVRAAKNMRNLHNTSNQFLLMAHRLITSGINMFESLSVKDNTFLNSKLEYEKLLGVIEKELCDIDDQESNDSETGLPNNYEKIKYLEAKQKLSENSTCVHQSCSVRSVKSDVDEKYPENWSRDSLIDLNNVGNLPPVPEDIFTCFNNKQPCRTASLSSLKGMRKVKLFLQRAATNSDEDDSSDLEEQHEPTVDAESGDKPMKKLGNITEETHQE